MRTLARNDRTSASETQLQFDWLLGDANFYSFKRAETLTGLSDSFLEKLWDGEHHGLHISGHEYGAGEKGVRMTKRIARVFMVTLLVKSARYNPETKLAAFISCLREFGPADLFQVITVAQRLMAEKAPLFQPGQSGKR